MWSFRHLCVKCSPGAHSETPDTARVTRHNFVGSRELMGSDNQVNTWGLKITQDIFRSMKELGRSLPEHGTLSICNWEEGSAAACWNQSRLHTGHRAPLLCTDMAKQWQMWFLPSTDHQKCGYLTQKHCLISCKSASFPNFIRHQNLYRNLPNPLPTVNGMRAENLFSTRCQGDAWSRITHWETLP